MQALKYMKNVLRSRKKFKKLIRNKDKKYGTQIVGVCSWIDGLFKHASCNDAFYVSFR